MPIPTKLPKGCAGIRGVSDLVFLTSGGGSVQHANRLYILTVKRESVLNKKRTLEAQLAQIEAQLREIEHDLKETDKKRLGLSGRRSRKSGKESKQNRDNGRRAKAVSLRY